MRARLQSKWHLTKQLYERGLDKQRIIAPYRFLDWVLNLPEVLAVEYESRQTAYEEECQVKYVTSIERHGIEKGMQAGIEKGVEKGSVRIILRQLQLRIGTLEVSVLASLRALPLEDIEHLGDALLSFAT